MNRSYFRRRLLNWFDRTHRDLPWRSHRDAYRIWVSEVMLQQTTVAAVIPYYHRFLEAFPTVADLAAADEQAVLQLWAGLGYYRRARHLHHAAKVLAAFGKHLPDDPAIWRELPGVGRYILGAVLSQAFDRRLPIIEANSLRVLCRLFARTGDPKSAGMQKWLWATAEELLPRRRAGDFNQALMELGSQVCTPAKPRCEVCPVRGNCSAFATKAQDRIPTKSPVRELTEIREVALVIRRGDEVFLAQRPDQSDRWAGMWEFPRGELRAGEMFEGAARRLLSHLTGLRAKLGPELLTIRHGVTRFRITMTALEATYTKGTFASSFYSQGLWLSPDALRKYPIGAAQRRLADAVVRNDKQRNLF